MNNQQNEYWWSEYIETPIPAPITAEVGVMVEASPRLRESFMARHGHKTLAWYFE